MACLVCVCVWTCQLNEEVMDDMRQTLWNDYGVVVNTSATNRRITDDWDSAQSLVRRQVCL